MRSLPCEAFPLSTALFKHKSHYVKYIKKFQVKYNYLQNDTVELPIFSHPQTRPHPAPSPLQLPPNAGTLTLCVLAILSWRGRCPN